MQLYNTKVIPASEDVLWEVPANLPAFTGAKLLVLSSPFDTNGPESGTLAKMMTACRLTASEYVVIQMEADRKLPIQALIAAGAPQRILLLGVSPSQLAINALLQPNHCNAFLGCTLIPGYALGLIEQQAGLKRELWEQGLKPCFGL